MCQLLKQDIVTSKFNPKNGWMYLPDAPGLGIELDQDALKTAKQTFADVNAI
jgi:L-alanine-DL-glutamate epimerase-like enolase superfamily enzyme